MYNYSESLNYPYLFTFFVKIIVFYHSWLKQ